MMTVGARELKTRLGSYLRQVREGAVILVTDRGRPIAELRPLSAATSDRDERLLELAAQGLVIPRTSPLAKPPKPIRIQGGPVSATISDEREDRFE